MARCPHCRQTYERKRMGQKSCESVPCAIAAGQARKAKEAAKKAKAARAEIRVRKEKAKTRRQWINEAQHAVNAWVRERDRDLPCISCGRHHEGQYHGGHYLSTGARPGLRFDPRNIWKQCQPCNTHLSGNLLNYRIGLIAKIGMDAVEVLEADHTVKKWSIDELREIRDTYRADLKRLKAAHD
jgi:hypothetical protein